MRWRARRQIRQRPSAVSICGRWLRCFRTSGATAVRAVSALGALVVAALTTLIVPIAVRRMIDFGFTARGVALIDSYFLVMIGVVGGARGSQRAALLPRHHARRAGRRRSARRRFRAPDLAVERVLRRGQDRRSAFRGSPPIRRRSRRRPAPRSRSRCAISCCSSALRRMMVVTSPLAFRLRALPPSRSSCCRSMPSAVRCAAARGRRRIRLPTLRPMRPS